MKQGGPKRLPNPIAKGLANGQYQQQRIPSAKKYTRKGTKFDPRLALTEK